MKYAVIGLGNFGRTLAIELAASGEEVLAADTHADRLDVVKDKISLAYRIDATDATSLASIPLKEMDVVIVAIGENLAASIKTVALLKQLKIKNIYARAIDDIHESILSALEITRILRPEYESARRMVQSMGKIVNEETLGIDSDHIISKFVIPDHFAGRSVGELKLDEEFGIEVLKVVRAESATNLIGIKSIKYSAVDELTSSTIVATGDMLVCYARFSDFVRFSKAL